MSTNFHLLTCNEDWADEHNVPCVALFDEKEYKEWRKAKISPSAHLGNSGDGWLEDYKGYTGAELMKAGIVQHFNVDESFAKTFKRARLQDLSLGNIFDFDEYYEDEEEEEEEEFLID